MNGSPRTRNHVLVGLLGAGTNVLGAARSLARERVSSIVLTSGNQTLVGHSRIPLAVHSVSQNGDPEADLLSAIEKWIPRESVLIPCSDRTVLTVARHSQDLSEHYRFVIPAQNIVETLVDKKREVQSIGSLGIPAPATCVGTADDMAIVNDFLFPIIVKPRSWSEASALGAKNWVLESPADWQAFKQMHAETLTDLVVQEYIPGGDEHLWVCNCLFDQRSNLVLAHTFQRLGLGPAHRGVTTHAISRWNPDIIESVEQIGKKLGYIGPAMFEFKYDVRDSLYRYIEINPRIGMCNFFDTACGINNVYGTYLLATEQFDASRCCRRQKRERVYLNLWSDLESRLHDKQSPLRILAAYFKYCHKRHAGVAWWTRDPFPELAQAAHFFRTLRRAIRKRTRQFLGLESSH